MIRREFLGWDRPFLGRAVEWLLREPERLAETLLVVPTAQGGRRLREGLAAAGGAVLAPRVTTPGGLMRAAAAGAAADWVERLAWTEVLEGVVDWGEYAGLFPETPEVGDGWAEGLGEELLGLRRQLQEGGWMLGPAARRLVGSVEEGRWEALGRLEGLVERRMEEWGLRSRSRVLAGGVELPGGFGRIVLAGVADVPVVVERALLAEEREAVVLIGAPEEEAEGFSAVGRPLAGWCERVLRWPAGDGGSVILAADPRQQAVEALGVVRKGGRGSDEVALGSADDEVGGELERAFSRAGWRAFHPAAVVVEGGLRRWLKVWVKWLREPVLGVVGELLELPETGVLVGGSRGWKALQLAKLRDAGMLLDGAGLRAWVEREDFRKEEDRVAAVEVLAMVEGLLRWRAEFSGAGWFEGLGRLLGEFERAGGEAGVLAGEMAGWLGEAEWLVRRTRRDAGFWLRLMMAEFPAAGAVPPEGRVIDVQGWLELFHEPGEHLVLCGMNEGMVPMRVGGEPWLGERLRERLGLSREVDRAARDGFLLEAMVRARAAGGRVDLICGKVGGGGDRLLPSRLLLAAERAELPERVAVLFRELEPPEAGLRSELDWRWMPRVVRVPASVSITSLRDWLACPFRYALKNLSRMQVPGTGRIEWNARDFGNMAHEVFERWGRDEEAREFSKVEALEAWFSAALDGVMAEWFGKRPPLAVRIQCEALRQRLGWVAREQACARAEGWQVVAVERPVEMQVGGMKVTARLDRIDRNLNDGRWRVLDYKTGDVAGVEKAHRVKVGGAAKLPGHLPEGCPALLETVDEKGKAALWRWIHLQLPFYAMAMLDDGSTDGALAVPGYFTVGETRGAVGIREWAGFGMDDLEAARACVEWVVGEISRGVFGPPAERVTYDDYRGLAVRGDLAAAFGAEAVPHSSL